MTPDDLKLAFAVSQSQVNVYLKDVTPELALTRPPNGGNTIHWILGHILAERLEAVSRNDSPIPDTVPDLSNYTTGSTPEENPVLSFDELKALIPLSFDLINRMLDSLNENALNATIDSTILGQPPTRAQDLFVYTQHEMYHIGQISLARRVLGMPGVGF
ncbi:DinB family protein [bacterium]|nr:DinB family protein [bacterium]